MIHAADRSGSDEAYSDEVAAEQGIACTQDLQLQQGNTRYDSQSWQNRFYAAS
jgi:hypothetical protein